MFTISNAELSIDLSAKGAELQRIYNNQTGIDYLWDANPAFWAKKSPVLFPIVGGLRNNQYRHKGRTYQLGRHGFARDMQFVPDSADDRSAMSFTLAANHETLEKYPFHFRFTVTYRIASNRLHVGYRVENTGHEALFFSIGAHPAFRVPLTDDTLFEDYYLEFNQPENAPRWPLTTDGLIQTSPVPYFNATNKLPLERSLFYQDALVFKNLQSTSITLKSDETPHGVSVSYEGFPYMGLWNFKDADFVCIEPWCGIADAENASGELSEKEGIRQLEPQGIFELGWQATFF